MLTDNAFVLAVLSGYARSLLPHRLSPCARFFGARASPVLPRTLLAKSVRPELTPEQHEEIKQCFELMDVDGSGTVDVDEVHAAMKLLSISARRCDVERMVNEWDADGSGEIELPEFIAMMTSEIQTQIASQEMERDRGGGQLAGGMQQHSFQMIAQGLRRKNMLDKVMAGDKAARRELQEQLEQKSAFSLADSSRYARRRSVLMAASSAAISRFLGTSDAKQESLALLGVEGDKAAEGELRRHFVSKDDIRRARAEAAGRLRLASKAAKRAEMSLFTLRPDDMENIAETQNTKWSPSPPPPPSARLSPKRLLPCRSADTAALAAAVSEGNVLAAVEVRRGGMVETPNSGRLMRTVSEPVPGTSAQARNLSSMLVGGPRDDALANWLKERGLEIPAENPKPDSWLKPNTRPGVSAAPLPPAGAAPASSARAMVLGLNAGVAASFSGAIGGRGRAVAAVRAAAIGGKSASFSGPIGRPRPSYGVSATGARLVSVARGAVAMRPGARALSNGLRRPKAAAAPSLLD